MFNLTLMDSHAEKVIDDTYIKTWSGMNHNKSFHQKQIIPSNIVLWVYRNQSDYIVKSWANFLHVWWMHVFLSPSPSPLPFHPSEEGPLHTSLVLFKGFLAPVSCPGVTVWVSVKHIDTILIVMDKNSLCWKKKKIMYLYWKVRHNINVFPWFIFFLENNDLAEYCLSKQRQIYPNFATLSKL